MLFNAGWVGTPPTLQVNSQSSLDVLQCTSRASSSRFPDGGVQPQLDYVDRYETTDRHFVGVSFNGALIGWGNALGQDVFKPRVGLDSINATLDQCLGFVNSLRYVDQYRYFSFSPCMTTPSSTIKLAQPTLCGADDACEKDPFKYAIENMDPTYKDLKVVGIARDGHLIYGPYKDAINLWQPTEVDICNGKIINGKYAYVMTFFFPYTVGCYGPATNSYEFSPSCSVNTRNILITGNSAILRSGIAILVTMAAIFGMA